MLATVEISMADASRAQAAGRTGRRCAHAAPAALGATSLALPRRCATSSGSAARERAICGAAPIAPQVLEYFWALGVPVCEGYGQTENTAVCTLMPSDDVRIGTVGKPLRGRRAADRRGRRDPHALAGRVRRLLQGPRRPPPPPIDADGWLHTGDVGELDDDGYLTITDRKKDIIITAGGKNVSPSEIENSSRSRRTCARRWWSATGASTSSR